MCPYEGYDVRMEEVREMVVGPTCCGYEERKCYEFKAEQEVNMVNMEDTYDVWRTYQTDIFSAFSLAD